MLAPRQASLASIGRPTPARSVRRGADHADGRRRPCSKPPVIAEVHESLVDPWRRNQDVRFRAAVGGQADVGQGTGRADQCLTGLTQKSPSFAAGSSQGERRRCRGRRSQSIMLHTMRAIPRWNWYGFWYATPLSHRRYLAHLSTSHAADAAAHTGAAMRYIEELTDPQGPRLLIKRPCQHSSCFWA
jgi:hypothetical protein